MKLSIVTINYNNAEGLRKTLASVVMQTYTDFEHVIVDGASTDNSVEIIKQYEKEALSKGIKVTWISEKDNGIYNAMNKGIRMSSGEYIEILNSGDCLASNSVVKDMLIALEQNAYPKILYGNMLKTFDWETYKRDTSCKNPDYTPDSFLYFYNGTLNHNSAYIKRTLFEQFGFYNEKMKICSDWEWYVRTIVLGNISPIYVNIDVTIFDMNGISESAGRNKHIIQQERSEYLSSAFPKTIINDYKNYAFVLLQYQRLKKYHLWGLVRFVERVLFKLEKWRIIK
ncbi:MAG: glycosyltransferase [Paludibacteraceae bacterium]|nr:glycosyltransferase [Paludibacteraceae bacterium]